MRDNNILNIWNPGEASGMEGFAVFASSTITECIKSRCIAEQDVSKLASRFILIC